ncbi:hypothetical protein ACJX0J_042362, partial [Zea mays]
SMICNNECAEWECPEDQILSRIIEASYLKLCGTISETPAELRNEQSYENNLQTTNECDSKPTYGPPANCKLLFEANSSQGQRNPRCEERHSLRSIMNTEDAGRHHGAEYVPHSASSEKRLFQNMQHKPLDSGGSPFPTPLVLRDDMQTPGTAYASHRGPIYLESVRLFTICTTKDPTQASSTSLVKSGLSETPSYYAPDPNASYGNAALSLFRWLKSSSADAENQDDDDGSFLTEKPVFMVAPDLTSNPTLRLPKAWDGNSIPNTKDAWTFLPNCSKDFLMPP